MNTMKIGVLKRADLNANLQNQVTTLFKQLSPNKKQIALDKLLKK